MGACSSRCAADINNRLTDHKTHDCTKKGKQPERLDEGWHKMKEAAQEATNEERVLPAKLVRDWADN